MQRSDEAEALGLVAEIERLTDEIAAVFGEKPTPADGDIDEAQRLYDKRGELLLSLNERYYRPESGWRTQENFREALGRIQQKNNALTAAIARLTGLASQRLRDSAKQRALLAYSQQQ